MSQRPNGRVRRLLVVQILSSTYCWFPSGAEDGAHISFIVLYFSLSFTFVLVSSSRLTRQLYIAHESCQDANNCTHITLFAAPCILNLFNLASILE